MGSAPMPFGVRIALIMTIAFLAAVSAGVLTVLETGSPYKGLLAAGGAGVTAAVVANTMISA